MSTNPSPRSKQQKLADLIAHAGITDWLRRLHDRGRTSALILAYHRVSTITRPEKYPLDLGLVSATAEEFAAQMSMVRELANPVALDHIADAVTHGRALPDRAVAVTFDDSFGDTFEVAFPIMRQHGIPATIFVSTEHVERNEPFWFEITAHLMLRVPAHAIRFEECPAGLPAGDDTDTRRAGIGTLHAILKRCGNTRRRQLVEQWRRDFAPFIDANAEELSRPVSREQVLQMAAGGMAFGSHTMSHPNLALASDAVIESELRGSKAWLERLLETPVRSLAYPFGTADSYDARALSIARACGYELAVSYRQGVNWLGSLDPLQLRRIGISPGVTTNQFRAMLALPAWMHPHLHHDHE